MIFLSINFKTFWKTFHLLSEYEAAILLTLFIMIVKSSNMS